MEKTDLRFNGANVRGINKLIEIESIITLIIVGNIFVLRVRESMNIFVEKMCVGVRTTSDIFSFAD